MRWSGSTSSAICGPVYGGFGSVFELVDRDRRQSRFGDLLGPVRLHQRSCLRPQPTRRAGAIDTARWMRDRRRSQGVLLAVVIVRHDAGAGAVWLGLADARRRRLGRPLEIHV